MKQRIFHHRRGGLYVLALSSALVVTIIGLSALTVVRIERRKAEAAADFSEARFYAQSAIDLGQYLVKTDANWRTGRANGAWFNNAPLGNGTFSLSVTDPADANLGDSVNEAVVLLGTGTKGASRCKLQVTMDAPQTPLSCLEVSLFAGGSLTLTSVNLQSDQIIATNGTATALLATVAADVEAGVAVVGATFTKTTKSLVAARTLPASATVFNDYIAGGTTISYASLPQQSGEAIIERVLISPNSNPYNVNKNANGVYVINCGGNAVVVRNCRIVGTLVLLNVGGSSRVEQSVNWSPAVANYPALLAQGNLDFKFTTSTLSESSGGSNVNFNPSGTPYSGSSDNDTSDSYPSKVAGLVYVSGNVNVANHPTFDGVVVVGGSLQTSSSSSLTLTYQSTWHDNPPSGFTEPPVMKIAPGSWRQVVD